MQDFGKGTIFSKTPKFINFHQISHENETIVAKKGGGVRGTHWTPSGSAPDTTKIKDLIFFQQLMTLMQINNFVLKILSETEVVVCGVK